MIGFRLVALAVAVGGLTAPAIAAERPNVVILLCDDLGYGDLSCFAHPKIRTPHLDKLAAEGVRLTHCYASAPVCSPSRAGLLTGRVPNRLGIRDWIPAGSGIFLRSEEVTLARLLKDAGYRTGHAGKWHLNSKTDGSEPTPGDAGFDHWLYTQNNAAPSHLNPTNFLRNGKPAGRLEGPSSHLVVAEAIQFLEANRGQPFFLNLWFHEPHEPIAAAEEFLRLYPGEDNPDRRHYYGDVTQVDAAVGKLLAYLEDHKLRDNTLIFFTSDNGPETLRRYKGAERSYGSPGPLRGMKLHITEAGYRVPGIVRWPGHTKASSVCAEPVCNVDVLPTVCAIAGIRLPERKLDGADITPIFDGRPVKRPHPLYWQYDFAISRPWTVALRDGPWKLLANADLDRFELYNLVDDVGESKNLADRYPERVRQMAAEMKRLHEEVQAEGAKSGNKLPDYRPVPGWPKLPEGVTLGPVSAVATDAADRVYVLHRGKRPVLVFDRDGRFLRSWGDDHFKTPHGLRIDRDGNVWATDIGNHQVLKFDAEGKLLLALGQKGEPGAGPDHFDRPTDVAVAADGTFYVADGYGNARVLKFSRDARLLSQWGRKGKGEGEFDLPHAVCLDERGRVYVGDRENARVQVFDPDGKFLAVWKESGAPYGLFLVGNRLFVTDGRAGWVKVLDGEGRPLGRFGEKGEGPGQLRMPHMLCVDSRGAVYVAEVEGKRVQKFVPRRE